MYICNDCQKTFEETKHVVNKHGLDTPPYEEWEGCPYCESWSYEEAEMCERCGDYFSPEDLSTISDDGCSYCENCKDEMFR